MTGFDVLAGSLQLHPGQAPPNISSTRSAWARSVARGQPAATLPDRLAAIFTLCADAHRLTSRQALAAAGAPALPGPVDAAAPDLALQAGTLREHLRRIWLDWPPALAGQTALQADLLALRDCPLLRRGAEPRDALAAMPAWVEAHLLGEPALPWLAAWEADPPYALAGWTARRATPAARLLDHCGATAAALARAPAPLAVHAHTDALRGLAEAMRGDPDFVLAPLWHGAAAETGPWTRLNESAPARLDNAWLRLGARLAEAVRLSLPDTPGRCGASWLRQGALALGDGEGLAWCEMSRGLLVHRVQLDSTATGGPCIAECDVLAPTEWNFHPRGAVARALAALPAQDADDHAVRVLVAAFDPCVNAHVARTSAAGRGHA